METPVDNLGWPYFLVNTFNHCQLQ